MSTYNFIVRFYRFYQLDLNTLLRYSFYGEMCTGMARRWAFCLKYIAKSMYFSSIEFFGYLHEYILRCSFQINFELPFLWTLSFIKTFEVEGVRQESIDQEFIQICTIQKSTSLQFLSKLRI